MSSFKRSDINRNAIHKIMSRKVKQKKNEIRNMREEQITNYLETLKGKKTYPKEWLNQKKII